MSLKKLSTEIVVIGAGPGGYAAAFRASDLGKKVILVEKDSVLGGVCLNRGCIPSKTLLHLARVVSEAKEVRLAGIEFGDPSIDLDKVRRWKTKVVKRLQGGVALMAKNRNVEVITGSATFTSNAEILVEGEENISISFEKAIIATGSRASTLPNIDMTIDGIMGSREALELENIPERLLVVGGGYIGLEMASAYAGLGSKVTVVEFMSSLLPGADADLVRPLHKVLTKALEGIYLSTEVKSVKKETDGLVVSFKAAEKDFTENFDGVLVSVGRKPNTEMLGLEKAGLKASKRGFIEVNEKQQTAVPHIFAIGDITGDPMLAHKATHEGKVAAEVIAGLPAAMDAKAIPAVIYTDPEIAWAGLTEADAKEKNIAYEKGEFPWSASGRALSYGRNDGKTKILCDPKTKQVLGVGIVGLGAGDLISEGVLAIEMGADAEDIGLSIHPHPTFSETLAGAAEVITGSVTDLFIPSKK